MLVVHPNNDDDDDDDDAPRHRSQSNGLPSDENAILCKKSTFSLCMEIKKALKSGSDDSVVVSRKDLENWFSRLKEANKSISRYVRTVSVEHQRSEVELHMLRHSMFTDILDREASYTETLEAIASIDGKQEKVARAMRFIATLNSGLSSLAAEETVLDTCVEKCASVRDA